MVVGRLHGQPAHATCREAYSVHSEIDAGPRGPHGKAVELPEGSLRGDGSRARAALASAILRTAASNTVCRRIELSSVSSQAMVLPTPWSSHH